MKNLSLLLFILLLISCTPKTWQATTYDYAKPVDTKTKPIALQEKKQYKIDGIYADNQFDGARLNDFNRLNDSTWQVLITPENHPINSSPWYAFRLWADEEQTIYLQLAYKHAKHRYLPKLSSDGLNWKALNKTAVQMPEDKSTATFKVLLTKKPLWISAQELITSSHVKTWCETQAAKPYASFSSIGKSKLGADMLFLDINKGKTKKKPIIAIISRQHPPEVTGFLAMQAFVEEILADTKLSQKFREKYRIMVFPLMNPDGVDQGHWRHNGGGIDLNRDWAYYHQPETRQVANFMVQTSKKEKAKVMLGLDFHSTYYDIYYTNNNANKSNLPTFKDEWLKGIEANIPDYEVKESSSAEARPVSKNWFYTQFNADGVTYEIGDDTDRDFIKVKGKTSAKVMMEILVK